MASSSVSVVIQGRRSTLDLETFRNVVGPMKKPIAGLEGACLGNDIWRYSWDLDAFIKAKSAHKIAAALARMPSKVAALALKAHPTRAPAICMIMASRTPRQYSEVTEEFEALQHMQPGIVSQPIAATA